MYYLRDISDGRVVQDLSVGGAVGVGGVEVEEGVSLEGGAGGQGPGRLGQDRAVVVDVSDLHLE